MYTKMTQIKTVEQSSVWNYWHLAVTNSRINKVIWINKQVNKRMNKIKRDGNWTWRRTWLWFAGVDVVDGWVEPQVTHCHAVLQQSHYPHLRLGLGITWLQRIPFSHEPVLIATRHALSCQRTTELWAVTESIFAAYSQHGWRRGVVVSGVRLTNVVNAHRARLVLRWVTVFGRVYCLGM